MSTTPAVWFPTVRTGTGTDVFTERLVAGLQARGLRAEITWLPLRAEYAPWSVPVPRAPAWATVCHVNTWLHPRFIPKRLPVVATLHHSIHDPALRPYKGWLRAAYHRYWVASIERRVLCRADRVVAVSRFVANMARQTLCDVPMQVIYNGVDTDRFRPGDGRRLPGQPCRLLYVGAWRTLKGVDLLAPIMRELGDGFVLHYTGGQAAERYKASMPANMHDLGRLTSAQVIAAMQEADVFLFPSRSEGLPQAVVEALACGLPVVAMQGTAVAEAIMGGTAGALCPREDVHAMAAAARRMASDEGVRLRERKEARGIALGRFRVGHMVNTYIDAYRELSGCNS